MMICPLKRGVLRVAVVVVPQVLTVFRLPVSLVCPG
jgi:hypothetical protein